MEFFLLTTKHLLKDLLFKDDEDFRAAMNFVAVAAFVTGVNILAFIHMSNHMHFVLSCPSGKVLQFINRFKTLYGRYYSRKYGKKNHLRRLSVDIKQVWIEDESLFRAIAYVQMNCVAANICPYPYMYKWGTGSIFFNGNTPAFTLLGSMSETKQAQLLHSNVILPQNYRVSSDGYILPESYVPVGYVESLFKKSNQYLYYLNTSSKSRAHLEKDAAPSFSDQVLVAAIRDLCRSQYRRGSYDELSDYDKSDLVRNVRRRFSTDANQLCRVLGKPYDEVARRLDSF